jgi:hypothetical protein
MTGPDYVELAKSLGAYLGTGSALLTFLVKYKEKNDSLDRSTPPKKADYDLAIDAYKDEPFLRCLFEDIKKVELIKKNSGIHVTPDEIGALIGFHKKGRVSISVIKRAWAYRKVKRDEKGNPVDLEFPVTGFDAFVFWIGSLYFWLTFILLFVVLGMNLYFGLTMPLPIMAGFLFLVLYLIGFVMLDAQSAARYVQRKTKD